MTKERMGLLFAGITDLSRAGAPSQHNPPGKLYTLTVKAFDRRGRRATADLGAVMNADNVEDFLAAQGFYNGELAFSDGEFAASRHGRVLRRPGLGTAV